METLSDYDARLVEVLLDSLTLNWEDNGNISADAVRDACLRVLSEVTGDEPDTILALIDQRVQQQQ